MKRTVNAPDASSTTHAAKTLPTRNRRRATPRFASNAAPIGPVSRSISLDFADAYAISPATAKQLALERLVATTRTDQDRMRDAADLVQWASAPERSAHRRTLIAAFTQCKAEIVLIHKLSDLPREQVAAFIKDYFAAGGKLTPIMRWMRMAGGAIRRNRTGTRTAARRAAWRPAHAPARNIIKDIWNGAENVVKDIWDKGGDLVDKGVDAVGNAIDALADAVTKAGKSLAQMVTEAANWTVGEVTDLVEALVRAGKKVGDILAAAAAKSIDQLKKYVEALLDAGRSLGELMSWAVTQAATIANAVVAQMIALGRKVLDIVKAVLTLGRTAMIATLRAALAAGKTLYEVISAVASEAIAVVQPVMDALLGVGKTLREILAEVAKLSVTASRNVVSALLNLGRTLTQILADAAALAGTALRDVVQTLLDLGKSIAQLLAAVVKQAASVMKVLISAFIALGKALPELVRSAVSQTPAVVKAVIAALVSLGYKAVDILITVAERTLNAKVLVMEALIGIGFGLGALIADICTGIVEGFRKGFFEGLVALGKTPLQLLQAAFEVKASIVLLALPVILEMFGGYRQLTRAERTEAEIIFGSSIVLDRVKVGFAKLPYDVIDYVNLEIPRAFTTMYLINFGPGSTENKSASDIMSTIIHELAHVWQGIQTGPLYMTRALEAQMGAGVKSLLHSGEYSDDAAYRVTAQQLADNGGDLSKFNPEQQAQIVEDFWRATRNGATNTHPVEALRPYARTVFKPITARLRKPLRGVPRVAARGTVRASQRAAAWA